MSKKIKRRAGNISENEIILIQNRFRAGKKILYVLILLGLMLSVAYNWRHFLYDFHLWYPKDCISYKTKLFFSLFYAIF